MSTKRPPIEPLSRPAWERVEAGLFARLDRGEHLGEPLSVPSVEEPAAVSPRRRVWWLAGAFAAAASVALWWSVESSNDVVPVAQTVPAEMPAARIVSTDSPTRTTLGESVLVLAAHSEANVSGSDTAGWSVRLESGEVDCQVAPRQGRPPFVVQAGATRVTVVGTRFSVERVGAEARVRVAEGRVQVDSGESHVLLGAGELWPKLELPDAAPPEPSKEDTQLSEPELSEPELSETKPPASARASKARPPAPQRFDRAARLESKEPRAALAIYHDLARGSGPWAANSLYAAARLELELGHPRRAERLLRRYLTKYPQGLNAPDVRKLLERIEP